MFIMRITLKANVLEGTQVFVFCLFFCLFVTIFKHFIVFSFAETRLVTQFLDSSSLFELAASLSAFYSCTTKPKEACSCGKKKSNVVCTRVNHFSSTAVAEFGNCQLPPAGGTIQLMLRSRALGSVVFTKVIQSVTQGGSTN